MLYEPTISTPPENVLAVLFITVQFLIKLYPPLIYIPPAEVAELLIKVQFSTKLFPLLINIPPPFSAVLLIKSDPRMVK